MMNVPYTLLNPTAGMAKPTGLEVDRDFGGVINDAYANGVGAAIYSPLAGGFLTNPIVAGGDRHPLAGPRNTDSEAYRRNLQSAQSLSVLMREGPEGTDSLSQAAIRAESPRDAERRSSAPWPQPPPRMTRPKPDPGPLGLRWSSVE